LEESGQGFEDSRVQVKKQKSGVKKAGVRIQESELRIFAVSNNLSF
jgi:hypothetical protein